MTYDTDTINNIKFTQGFRGYDTAEVDEFLDDMIREIEKLNNTIKGLKEEVAKEKRTNLLSQQEVQRLSELNESLRTSGGESVAAPTNAPVAMPEPIPQPLKIRKPSSIEDLKGSPEYEEMKQVLTNTLLSAQQHADKLVKDAEIQANKLIEDGERRAKDRIVSLTVEISESQKRLDVLNEIVIKAKRKYKQEFKNQIDAIDSINIEGASNDSYDQGFNKPSATEVIREPKREHFSSPNLPSLEDRNTELKVNSFGEPESNAIKVDSSVNELKEESADDDTQAPARQGYQTGTQHPSAAYSDGTEEAEDDNQQYIELALSAYNDNKHHNSDYPESHSDLKINEDDDQDGIYQPENRSVLSSVIEDILNNKNREE